MSSQVRKEISQEVAQELLEACKEAINYIALQENAQKDNFLIVSRILKSAIAKAEQA